MKIMVCGLGQPLYHLSKLLLSKGYQLTLVAPDQNQCNGLAREYKADVIFGDPTREEVLREAGALENKVLISMFPNDEDNYVMALLALYCFQPLRTVIMVNNPSNVDFFRKMGVNVTISVPNIISSLVEEGINEEIINLQPLEDGKLHSMLISVVDQSPLNGKKVGELPFIQESKIAAVLRNGSFVTEDQAIMPGDKLLVLVSPIAQGKVIREYTGQR